MTNAKITNGLNKIIKLGFSNKVFIVIFLIAFLNYNSSTMLKLTLPKFAFEMGESAQAIGLLSGIFAMCALLMRPISGQIVDNEDKLVMLRITFVALLVSVLGLTQSTNYNLLLVFRGLNGLAWGVGSTLCMTIAANCFSLENMATGIGFYGLGQTLAQTTGPMIALPFAEKYGYNALYYFNVGLMILCFGLTYLLKLDPQPNKKRKYSFNIREMVYFPAILPSAVTLANAIAQAAITAFLVIFSGEMKIGNIALFFTVQAIVLFVFRPLLGKLSDKYGALKMLVFVEILIVISMLLVAQANDLTMLLVAAVLGGIGTAGSQPILMAECVRAADKSKRGSASNTSYLGTDIGQFVGANIAGFLVAYLGYRNMFMAVVVPVILITAYYVYAQLKSHRGNVITAPYVMVQEDKNVCPGWKFRISSKTQRNQRLSL
jgi:MFS family permease